MPTSHRATRPFRPRAPGGPAAAAIVLVFALLGAGCAAQTLPDPADTDRATTTGTTPARSSADPVHNPAPAPVATGLDPQLAERFAQAQAAAAAEGVELTLTSGWRSVEEQDALIEQALDRYGDPTEAHRWVLPPEHSAHVQGRAIDVGPTEGALWLQQRASDFGLCRTYLNEVWHYELPPEGADTCPEPHADASWAW